MPLLPWRLRNGGQPHEMWFWIKFSLRFCILVILYLWRFFFKVYTAWKRLSTKEQLKWYLVHLNFVSYSTDDWTCCLTVLGNCFTLELSPACLTMQTQILKLLCSQVAMCFPYSFSLLNFLSSLTIDMCYHSCFKNHILWILFAMQHGKK